MSLAEDVRVGTAMRAIDDAFVAGVAGGAEPWVTSVRVSRERPFIDIEVISDPFIDAPLLDGARADADALSHAFLARYERLREPFGEAPPRAVLMRGPREIDPAAALDAEQRAAVWARVGDALRERGSTVLDVGPAATPTAEVGAVYRVGFGASTALGSQHAYVVVVGWPAGDGADEALRLAGAERLILALADSIAVNTPVHVLGVAGGTRLPASFLAECQRLQMSLVIHGASERSDLLRLTRTILRPGAGAASTEVAVVPCPDFKRGVGRPGLARVRVNVEKGEAEVAFRHDLGSDRSPAPMQVVWPLVSASRVTSSERRLYNRVHELIAKELGADDLQPTRRDELLAFRDYAKRIWDESGYAALCDEAGALPIRETRHTEYHLLLLLRRRDDGYDILLSNHSPMRPSQLSDWNTLLLPAFKDVRELLGNLRSDVLRQLAERADDFERVEHAQAFQQAVESILAEEGKPGDELWAEELREVANKQIRKISPTNGAVTKYDYHLVTLLPLIDRSIARPVADGAEPEARRRREKHTIVAWLEGLDTVRVGEAAPQTARGLAAEALLSGGAGLRWDPKVNLVAQPRAADRLRAERAFPGAVWFPLVDRDRKSLWRQCPAIVARNADVMSWVERVLADISRSEDRYPTEFVLGRHASESEAYEPVGSVFPFESEHPPTADVAHAPTTVEAIRRITFAEDYDLAGRPAYRDAEVRRVFLVRGRRTVRGHSRDGIFVYAARARESAQDAVVRGEVLGMLRPVQRYVLTAGLERAAMINRLLSETLADDEWGFVHVRKGSAPKPVTVTPPIIEELHEADLDDCPYKTDFIVCDGNHRVVEKVWRRTEPMAAIAVTGKLAQPYYARPFGRLEWDATSDNELVMTPQLASKYLARKVDRRRDLPPGANANVADRDLFRRYYRDLTTGFGYMGGQGGQYV